MFYFTYKFKFATISFDANRLVVIILCPIDITKNLYSAASRKLHYEQKQYLF